MYLSAPALHQDAALNPLSTPGDTSDRRHFVKDMDYLIGAVDTNRIQNLSFRIDDIPFHVMHRKDSGAGASTLCIQAVLGYLPFSIESGDKRAAILTIIDATRALFHVRFGVDHYGKIFAAGEFTSRPLASPDLVFYPLTHFLQEAQPFIQLIGTYL